MVGLLAGLVVAWLVLAITLWRVRPADTTITQALRLLPDTVRLVRRLAADGSLPRGVRVRLWLLLGYLAMPIDLVPDFIPVLGYADDVILVGWVLRGVVRRAGDEAVDRHWPGTPEGLAVIRHLVGRADRGR